MPSCAPIAYSPAQMSDAAPPALPTAPPDRRSALVLVALALVVRLAFLYGLTETPLVQVVDAFTSSDMHHYWQWARAIREGDVLGRETPHPFFGWMRMCGPMEAWYGLWGGRTIFQQAPLYPYLLAALTTLTGGSLVAVVAVQLLLGVARTLVVWRLAARLFGEGVGTWAGVLCALYGPFVFYEGTILRDWLPPLLEPLAVLLLLHAAEAGRRRSWFIAGLVFGTALVTRESALAFVALGGAWALLRVKPKMLLPRSLGLLGAGVLAVLAPLLVRNLVTGAPPFAISNRAPEVIAEGNAKDASLTGQYHPASLCPILARAGGSAALAAWGTVETWDGDVAALAHAQLTKLRAVFDPAEVPDQLDFNYALEVVPVLRVLPRLGLLLPLAVAGLVALPGFPARNRMLFLGCAAAAWLPLQVLPVFSRYRLSLVPWLMVLAALALYRIESAFRGGAVAPALRAATGILAGLLLVFGPLRLPQVASLPPRTQEPLMVAQIWEQRGEPGRALTEISNLRQRFAADGREEPPLLASLSGDYRVRYAHRLLDAGRTEEARHQAGLAEGEYASVAEARPLFNLGVLWARLGDAPRARVHLSQFLTLAPEDAMAAQARALLVRLSAPTGP